MQSLLSKYLSCCSRHNFQKKITFYLRIFLNLVQVSRALTKRNCNLVEVPRKCVSGHNSHEEYHSNLLRLMENASYGVLRELRDLLLFGLVKALTPQLK